MSSWCLAISVGIFMATVVCSLNLKNGKKRPTAAYYAFAGGTFVAATTLFIPIYAQQFINDLFSTLRERMLDLRFMKVIFVGGGAILLRRQIETSGKVGNPLFVNDINANAKGYEYLYQIEMTGR